MAENGVREDQMAPLIEGAQRKISSGQIPPLLHPDVKLAAQALQLLHSLACDWPRVDAARVQHNSKVIAYAAETHAGGLSTCSLSQSPGRKQQLTALVSPGEKAPDGRLAQQVEQLFVLLQSVSDRPQALLPSTSSEEAYQKTCQLL